MSTGAALQLQCDQDIQLFLIEAGVEQQRDHLRLVLKRRIDQHARIHRQLMRASVHRDPLRDAEFLRARVVVQANREGQLHDGFHTRRIDN